jgi:hypothetical protein
MLAVSNRNRSGSHLLSLSFYEIIPEITPQFFGFGLRNSLDIRLFRMFGGIIVMIRLRGVKRLP